ncbi:MAG: hypothetical protein K9N46_15410 [Candidatus Marinimicrobia bacterium]|nr:hypothetical protein [Candidatus Neomarinimicrobiota bacterium]MCF7830070.1 hypothetical protein [Candidatus Neomarinimicrobiota bacterium]MCF7882117.1 hypothetical protein [Candidatus Neomarinimicrobiota bacterium]
MKQYLIILAAVALLMTGCAAHSTISPDVLEPGEKMRTVTVSSETILPVITWRRGLSERSDFGFHLGIPLYGTGIDYTYQLREKPRSGGDIINFGAFLTPNTNLDFTYYKVATLGKQGNTHPYFGWRIMYIPSGISGENSTRFGFLAGLRLNNRFGVELGYFHDFEETDNWWYDDTVLATEKNPLTGFSLRVTFVRDFLRK